MREGLVVPAKFRILISATLLFLALPFQAFGLCKAGHSGKAANETVIVRHVHDGDTVILNDSRKLRLIGFDSPEIDNKQAYAVKARNYLRSLLKQHNNTLQLHYDIQQKDRYDRWLAHAFLPDGNSISQLMIQQGLATALIIPPNLKLTDCYLRAEQHARQLQTGLWQLPQYQARAIEDLQPYTKGYRVVRGRVDKIYQHRGSTFLQINNRHMVVRISSDDKFLFAPEFIKQLLHRKIEIRGRLRSDKHKKHKFYMRLRHPGALQLLD